MAPPLTTGLSVTFFVCIMDLLELKVYNKHHKRIYLVEKLDIQIGIAVCRDLEKLSTHEFGLIDLEFLGDWVRAEDKLPDESQYFFVYEKDKDLISYAYFDNRFKIFVEPKFSNNIEYNITHWMLLPEPPEV